MREGLRSDSHIQDSAAMEVSRRQIRVGRFTIQQDGRLFLIAGPCVIENADLCFRIAESCKEAAENIGMPFIFKASYDKANRTSAGSFRGMGLYRGLEILAEVRERLGVPVLSDVHCREEIEEAAKILDIIQIPAFLCRQTDLVQGAARTGKPVNIKKGQFLAPWDIKNVVEKIEAVGNQSVLLTERGASFGYNNLIADMRSIPIMKQTGCPVVFDGTHCVQLPGGQGASSGGQREMVAPLTRAAVAAGCDGLFLEVHENPVEALSDAATMLPLENLAPLLEQAQEIHQVVMRQSTMTKSQ